MSYIENYASRAIKEIFDDRRKHKLWRELWLALAKESKTFDAPITDDQITELKNTIDDIDYQLIDRINNETKHEIYAHIKAWAQIAPNGGKIIHLGATSCYVTDNSELIIIKDALKLLNIKLHQLLTNMHKFIETYKNLPCIGYTHMQAAQPTTLGKRACCWAQDFVYVWDDLFNFSNELPFRGVRGATGTQASFKTLFNSYSIVESINYNLAKTFGFDHICNVTGQTYSRYFDSKLIKLLSLLAEAASKFAHDIRLLSATGEVAEGGKQVGSSAMPYKCNPIKSERICGLARIIISHANSMGSTYATQWLERSLDDSLLRKVVIQESFYAADATITITTDIIKSLFVNEPKIGEVLKSNSHKINQEDYMIKEVVNGGDRLEIYNSLWDGSNKCDQTDSINTGYASTQASEFANSLLDSLRCANSLAASVSKIGPIGATDETAFDTNEQRL